MGFPGYYVATPNEYIVITGLGVEKIRVGKSGLVLPFQKCTRISIAPFDFSMSLQAMTIEKLQFSLPAVFTIGPEDVHESLEKYAILLTGGSDDERTKEPASSGRNHVQNIVKGIIEGETRSIVSTMTMEELFSQRMVFKQKVIKNVQSELDQFGLRIYNANVKELQDTPGTEYFKHLSQKAHEGAINQAKVDVAEARMLGEVGEAKRKGKMKQDISAINAETAMFETEQKAKKAVADAKLADREIHIRKDLSLSKIAADREAEQRDIELQKTVEQKKAEMELERLRATQVVEAKISRESAQQDADADFYTQQKKADATAYRAQADAEAAFYAKQKDAEATFFARQKEAEASLIARQKEAQGLMEMAAAYGELSKALGGPQGLIQYMMLQNGTYEKLAEANARAVQGLQPKINVWNTGAQGEGADPAAPLRNIFQTLPPLLSTINDQTGISPPSWLAQMQQQQAPEATDAKKKQLMGANGVNGTHGND